MKKTVTRLLPTPPEECVLPGLYLKHALNDRGTQENPFVYSNFITSLDGRIAIATEGRATHQVPGIVTNQRDWRLYQELAAQADVLITSGRFFRQAQIHEAQDRLPLSTDAMFADLHDWRKRQGLPAQPDIVILSRSLAIPRESLESYSDRRVMIFTGKQAEPERVAHLTAQGIEVIPAGTGRSVDGSLLVSRLGERGYRSLYAIAGPDVVHTLLVAKVLTRLYLTVTHQLLAGDEYDTITRGSSLTPAHGMHLVSLYHDPHAPAGAGQCFSVYESRGD